MISVIPDNFVSTCGSIKKYRSIEKIGEGWFGQVFKAEHKKSKNVVAMKKLLNLEIPSIASSTYRRISIMKKCKHESIAQAIEVCKSKKSDRIELIMIMPLYDYNLAGLIQNTELKLSVPVVKSILHQLLKSVSYIHGNNIIHRNLKPSNIFVTKDGVLKIGDFGLACCFWSSESVSYTSEAFSYRAPELLLGSQKYDRLVDMWSVGCIFAELFTRKKIFKSDCLQTHLELISDLCGSINSEVLPDVENLKLYKEMELPQGLKRKLRNRMKKKIKGNFGIDLLDKLLILHSKKRISASEALNHTYFDIKPQKDELVKIL